MNGNNQVALWAGVAAFFGSVLAVGVFDLLNIDGWKAFFSSLVVSAFTAGAVYAKERYEHAKRSDEHMERLKKRGNG